jgi:ATP-dependent exoDNAse (exonuclease V) alpha subunit
MLRKNLWTETGLVNGAVGNVVDLASKRGVVGGLPDAVLVHFEQYSGPAWDPARPKVIPICPHHFNWREGRNSLSRTQIPLSLSYGITIHKAQGATYSKAMVEIGDKEIDLGLTYVALSRVKSLDGLLLRGLLPWDRLERINRHAGHHARREAEQYLKRFS